MPCHDTVSERPHPAIRSPAYQDFTRGEVLAQIYAIVAHAAIWPHAARSAISGTQLEGVS
jgi:hypothetical protein